MKKTLSFLMAVLVALSMLSAVTAFASVETVYTENFDNSWSSNGHFGQSEDSKLSEIFFNGQWNSTYYAVQGFDGTENSALMFKTNEAGTADVSYFNLKSYVNHFGLQKGESLVFNMKFKLSGTATDGFMTHFQSGDGGKSVYLDVCGETASDKYYLVQNANWNGKGDKVYIEKGQWYNMSVRYMIVTESETDKINAECSVYDQDGNIIKRNSSYGTAPIGSTAYIHTESGLAAGGEITFDDAKLYHVKASDTFASVTDGTTPENTTIEPDGSVTVKFDQGVDASEEMFAVSGVQDAIESVKVKSYDTVTVKFKNLANSQSYTLDYSNVTSAGGSALSVASEKTLAFKTTIKKLYTDELEGPTFDENHFYKTSEVFTNGQYKGGYSITDGYTAGTNALKISHTEGGKPEFISTKPFADFGISEDVALEFTARFKLEGTPTEALDWFINPSSNVYPITHIYGTQEGQYFIDGYQTALKENTWYDMTISFVVDGYSSFSVYESETGKLIAARPVNISNVANRQLFIQTESLPAGLALIVDDVKLYCAEKTDKIALDASASTKDGATVDFDDEIVLKFDKNITPSNEMLVFSDGAMVEDIKVKNFNTVLVSFKNARPYFDYTLNYSAITSSSGYAVMGGDENILTFTTAYDPKHTISFKGNVSAEGVNQGCSISFDVYSKESTTATYIVAFYNATEPVGIEIFENTDVAQNDSTQILTLANDHTGATKVRVFAWNSIADMKPVMIASGDNSL